ncbi:MAG: 23S rRNA (guanosine(2251)-2'-O)-methyltransferase RlmB [Clostridia bacterium]|nr:23S rRNA (guanosine(2251)-2'-O)-methyltransferase RlmB [Clostridia bacterium]
MKLKNDKRFTKVDNTGFRKNRNDAKNSYSGPRFDDDKPIDSENELSGVVSGRNAVSELLKSDRAIDKIYVRKGNHEGSVTVIVAKALEKKIPVVEVEQRKLDFISGGTNHQGVVAMAAMKDYVDVDEILAIAEERGEKPLVVICDCIEDPHNLGAIIRCAECSGAHGIIIPKRHAVGITPAVYKSSAGAIEHMAIAKVSNIATTIEELKKKGLWIFACEAGGTPYYETDFDCPTAIILGSEGNGVGKLIKERSDYIVSIPMYGKVNSLNVSTAASVILCHAARIQREGK